MLSTRMPSSFAGDRLGWLPCPEISMNCNLTAQRSIVPSWHRLRCNSSAQKPQRRVPGSSSWAGQEHVTPGRIASPSLSLGEALGPEIGSAAEDGCSEARFPHQATNCPGFKRMLLLLAIASTTRDKSLLLSWGVAILEIPKCRRSRSLDGSHQ